MLTAALSLSLLPRCDGVEGLLAESLGFETSVICGTDPIDFPESMLTPRVRRLRFAVSAFMFKYRV